MLWIVLALLSINATLIVWLACVASGREEGTRLAQQSLHLGLAVNKVRQPVPVWLKEPHS